MKKLLIACLLAFLLPLGVTAQTLHMDVIRQFDYGDISYSWSDPVAMNLPTELFAFEDGGTEMLRRPGGYRRVAISYEGIGTTPLRLKVGDHRTRTFDSTADIDTTPLVEEMTITAGVSPHEYESPDGPYKVSGTCPAGLSATTLYFVEVVDANTIAFHLSWAEAAAASTATRVDLGVAAVGTCTIGGIPAAPTADSTDGYESVAVHAPSQSTAGGSQNWPPVVLWMPRRLSILVTATEPVIYWFLP